MVGALAILSMLAGSNFLREFDQWAELLQQRRASVSSQLCPVRFRFLSTGRSGSFHMEQLPVADCHLHHGASFGAYHAANSLFKHPDIIKRCFAMSGVYDLRNFMDGMYDDNFYFNNPVDYLSNASDPWFYNRLPVATFTLRLVLSVGKQRTNLPPLGSSLQQRDSPFARQLGPQGGHDWPY